MLKKLLVVTLVSFVFLFCMNLFAQISVPEVDPFTAIANLITNWKTLSPFAIGMALVSILVQLVKNGIFGAKLANFKYIKTLVMFLSIIYTLIATYLANGNWITALVTVFITYGGAIALYETLKAEKKAVV